MPYYNVSLTIEARDGMEAERILDCIIEQFNPTHVQFPVQPLAWEGAASIPDGTAYQLPLIVDTALPVASR